MNSVQNYIKNSGLENINVGLIAYLSNLEKVKEVAPEVAQSIVQELMDQRTNLKLIASENYCSLSVQSAMGNLLTDKYAEGFPGHRFYAGCDNIDFIENLACQEVKKLFNCEHAYVQPHSGADANLIAFWAILRTRVQLPELEKMGETNPLNLSREDWDVIREKLGNQKIMSLDLYSGGHLTHGYRYNVSAQMFDVYNYGVNPLTGLFDYDELHEMLKRIKPLIFLVGFSAYSRNIDYAKLRAMADEVNAVLMVDMAHFAGLVAGGVLTGNYNPIPFAHVVTSTTHKTLRGPRGGLILSTNEFAESVDKGCPLVIGGPLPHVMAAKAAAFREANEPEFKDYAHKIVQNSRMLAKELQEKGVKVLTGGTDNHIIQIDLRTFNLTGRQGESALRECSITLNRNTLPNDQNGPWYTSGLRLGTPAVTTLGMGVAQMKEIASIIHDVLANTKSAMTDSGEYSKANFELSTEIKESIKGRVSALLKEYPVYPELDLELLVKHFM